MWNGAGAVGGGVGWSDLGNDLRDDLLGRLAGDGAVTVGAVGLAHGGVKKPEVVVDFGDGADGGAGGAGGGFLLDGDGGGEAVDGVDVGAFHLIEELAGVGGEGFDITALPFGVDGIEGERAFAGAGEAGDDGEGVARNGDGNVPEIVLTGTADVDVREVLARNFSRRGQVSSLQEYAKVHNGSSQ